MMATAANRKIRKCEYCIGRHRPKRTHKKTCCKACSVAKSAALNADRVEPAILRRDTYCKTRFAATGWGLMTALEKEEADVRVRATAGLDVGGRVPLYGPALDVEGGYYLALWAAQEEHRATSPIQHPEKR